MIYGLTKTEIEAVAVVETIYSYVVALEIYISHCCCIFKKTNQSLKSNSGFSMNIKNSILNRLK